MSRNTEVKAVSRKDMTKAQWTWHEMKQNKVAYLMIAPFMILFFIFTVVPVIASFTFSLTSFNLLQAPKWVGLDNYITLFLDDELFITGLKNTLIFAVATGPASFLLSFIIAWFINDLPPKFRAFVTLVFYTPSLASNAYIVFTLLFSSDAYGIINGTLLDLGFIDTPILFFQDTKWIVPLCIIISLWSSFGTQFLSFIAGLQGVDKAQYEAAAIDGITNRFQELWYVTLPNMQSQLKFGAVLSITAAFGYGAVVESVAGNPTTDYVAYTVSMHIGEFSGNRWEIGYACAMAFLMFLMCFGSNMLVNKLLTKVGQ